MAAETGDPKKARDVGVPTNHETPVRGQGTQSGPAPTDGNFGQPGQVELDLFGEHFLDALVERWIASQQLSLIAGTEQQSRAFRTKINIMADVPNKRPLTIDPGQRGRNEQVTPARAQRQRSGAG